MAVASVLDPQYLSDEQLLTIFQTARKTGSTFTMTSSMNDGFDSNTESVSLLNTPSHSIVNIEDSITSNTLDSSQNCIDSKEVEKYVRKKSCRKRKLYSCFVCSEVFHSRCKYGLHYYATHGGVGVKNDPSKFVCNVCNKITTTATGYLDHILAHAKVMDYTCLVCNQQFTSHRNLYDHKVTKHRSAKFECKVCKKTFKYRSKYSRHLLFHNPIKSHKCNNCQQSFVTAYQLTRHKKTHVSGSIIFSCKVCTETHTSKISLAKHYKSRHPDCFKYVCERCGALYMNRFSLTRHMRSHEHKEYVCIHCNKAFHRKSVLDVHMKTHSGIKMFQCEKCEKFFSQKCSLLRHLAKQKDCRYIPL
uniref:Zinc finger protein n=1 Tax=Ciona intestinalis TaxID=7719 RepID=Q1RLA3_CIOIN|nr:zinc finger protein ZF(C2H2)-124 [Ciona intestinalis]FAA00162.1 TPA: zinc finger protein [Ciona intestinalis]|eukprot:NP_001122376.1 zinc finger protein ZF(C2H2)-124 [Ciona intestinalis]